MNLEFVKKSETIHPSNSGWLVRRHRYNVVRKGESGYGIETTEVQEHPVSGMERHISSGVMDETYPTFEAASESAQTMVLIKKAGNSEGAKKAWAARRAAGGGTHSKALGTPVSHSPAKPKFTEENPHGGPIPRTATQEKSHQKDLESDNWHTSTMAKMRDRSDSSLIYIREDARKAAKAMQSIGNAQKEGQYLDEAHYASMELTKRMKHHGPNVAKFDSTGLSPLLKK